MVIKKALLQRIRDSSSYVHLLAGLRIWIAVSSTSFLVVALWSHASQLRRLSLTETTWWWIALGIGLSWLSLVINAIGWCQLLSWLGYQGSNRVLVRLYLHSNLLKYLPGGIWHLANRLKLLQSRAGFGAAFTSVLLEPLLMGAAAMLWVALSGCDPGLAVIATIPSLTLVTPIREPLLRCIETLYARQIYNINSSHHTGTPTGALYQSRVGYPWQPLLVEFAFVACRFSGFWCCVQALSVATSLPIGRWLAAFAIAWTAGLVTPAAPGGLGVFEAVLLLLVGGQVPKASVLAVALSYRFVATLADLLAAASAYTNRALAT